MIHEPYIRHAEEKHLVILFIHGILGTPNHFNDIVEVVPENIGVYNMLLDGHGKRAENLAHTSMKKWKEQVKDTVEYLVNEYEKIIIVAHSMGTLFAINEAVKFSDKICGLFLLSVPLVVDVKPTAVKNSIKILLDKTDDSDEVLSAMKNGCSIELDRRLWNYFGWAPRYAELLLEISRVKEILPIMEIPCYVFQSKNDEVVSVKSQELFKTNPEINCFVLENSCHFYYSPEDREILIKEFKDFIKKQCN